MDVLELSTVIIIINTICCFSNIFNRKSRAVLLRFYVILYAVLFSMRSFEFPDTSEYYNIFLNAWSEKIRMNAEPLNIIIMRICYLGGFRTLLFLYTFMNEWVLLKAASMIYRLYCKGTQIWIKKEEMQLLVLCSYFSYFGFLYNAVILREGAAISMVFLGAAYAMDQKTLKSVFCVFAGMLFHLSAFAGILILFVIRFHVSHKRTFKIWYFAVIMLWACNAGTILFESFRSLFLYLARYIPFLSRYTYYVYYVSTTRSDGMYSKKDILFLLIAAYLVMHSTRNLYYKKLMTVFMTGIMCMVLLNSLYLAYRFYDYFLIFIVPLLVFHTDYTKIKIASGRNTIALGVNMLLSVAVIRYILSVIV